MFLQSNTLTLRDVTPEDAHYMAQWKSQPLMRKMSIGSDAEVSVENQQKDILRSLESDNEEYVTICLQDEPIGYIRINWMDDHKRHAWLRFGLGSHRGQGYAYEALQIFLDELFSHNVYRVEGEVYEYNEASYHLLLKLGFKEEGKKRMAHYDYDTYSDVYVMGLIASDR